MLDWVVGLIAHPTCEHVGNTLPEPRADACEECGQRFSLRMCGTCGHVGCCESSRGHARTHAFDAGHPVIHSMPAGRGFTWCYIENRYVK